MKKVFLTLLFATAFCMSGFAQKGMNGFGLNVPVGFYDGYSFFGVGVKYQYNISDYFRIEPSFEYFPLYSKKKVEGVDGYDHINLKAFLNGHIFLKSPSPARPYILVGAGFSMWSYNRIYSYYINDQTGNVVAYSNGGRSETSECFAYNVGVGYDIRLSHGLAMQIEATGYSSVGDNAMSGIKNYDHSNKFLFMGRIGFTYTF